ncbi:MULTISPECIES: FecCD family ABC transporter permease [Actinomadura]|uniref:FecCD family ABC transporter permease n=1 Tax=Actinomadura yumaensis TaxID=111807 RepID=A0ABW2CJU9_9ACTN|nr:iron chelate uptake ABC transporter family permease subunit [Actinomadura sp. J1-007]MWK33027.1 iron chelate uptake ABC transporter family permease subunit [Actinomadura sp. J1-007]
MSSVPLGSPQVFHATSAQSPPRTAPPEEPAPRPSAAAARPPASRRSVRAAGLAVSVLLLLAVLVLSLAVGARPLSLGDAWRGLYDSGSPAYTVVHEMRLPRTLLGLLAGAALGLAGAVMQALTRNPLADPGLLGINAGAAAVVVTAISFLGIGSFTGFVWFAFAGAGAVAVLLYAVGGGRGATPARLALAGSALNAALFSYVNAVQLLDTASLDRMRFWTVGSLASAQTYTIERVAPFVLAGLVLALLLARPLNALAMGDDSARALGANPARTRVGAIAAVTLLCGAATAACGPIVFVGLMVPHFVRALTGPDLRWLLPYCAVLSPVLMLGADVLGRVVVRPSELQVGIVMVVLGGPVFLYFVRRPRRLGTRRRASTGAAPEVAAP